LPDLDYSQQVERTKMCWVYFENLLIQMLGFRQLVRLDDYVKDMQAITHDYLLMGLDLKTDEEYAGVGG